MAGSLKKVVGLVLVVFLGFYMFTDPSGLAVAAKEGGPSRDWLNAELGFLASGDGICGTPLTEDQQGCTFWEQSGSFCFDGSGGGADSAYLECLSGTCRFICDFETNTESPLECPGTSSCGSNFNSYEGYGVDLAVCQ